MVAKNDDTSGHGSTRLTLVLDDDAVTVIRARSKATGESLGKVVSDLIREGQRVSDVGKRLPWVLPRRAHEPVVTTELVHRLQDELL